MWRQQDDSITGGNRPAIFVDALRFPNQFKHPRQRPKPGAAHFEQGAKRVLQTVPGETANACLVKFRETSPHIARCRPCGANRQPRQQTTERPCQALQQRQGQKRAKPKKKPKKQYFDNCDDPGFGDLFYMTDAASLSGRGMPRPYRAGNAATAPDSVALGNATATPNFIAFRKAATMPDPDGIGSTATRSG